MAIVKTAHQYAGDARVPFAFGGSGSGRVHITTNWTAVEVETVDASVQLYKVAAHCYLSNLAMRTSVMDVNATETLEWNVGTTIDGTEIYSGNGTTFGENASSVTHELSQATDESTESGIYLAAGTILYLSVEEVAATGAAGAITVSFDITAV